MATIPPDTATFTTTNGKGDTFDWTVVLTDEDKAMTMADDICYKRQREYTGWLSIDRFKLRAIIADAILEAVKAERARHDK